LNSRHVCNSLVSKAVYLVVKQDIAGIERPTIIGNEKSRCSTVNALKSEVNGPLDLGERYALPSIVQASA
jgi:hypothetical protein